MKKLNGIAAPPGPPMSLIGNCIRLLAACLLAGLAVGCTVLIPEPEISATPHSLEADHAAESAVDFLPHPTDPYFALDHVLDIAIDIPTTDWNALRRQTRTWETLLEEIETGCLAQPFSDIYSWFPAQVTVDGETHTDVGLRKKGFLGSLSSERPSLKLRFDKYVDNQSLGGVMERMTLNNGKQDSALINTCLAYQIFAAAGLPAPRCNFATVSVNNQDLGLYIHVEEIKPPFLARHFESAEGNLYEGTVSDFRPGWRGTFEKKTNEEENNWLDIDFVVAALQDPTPAGLEDLGIIVDRDLFLSFWATEVLVGQWDGYSGGRNNFYFYREPNQPFVFIPWGVDQTFSLEADPNKFDSISDPPPSVWAHGALAHRLYQDEAGQADYVSRIQELLDTVWDEQELLRAVDEMAAVVQQHVLPGKQAHVAGETAKIRQFIQKRRGEILEDLEPEPPDWPWPLAPAPCATSQSADSWGPGGHVFELGEVELHFATTWESNQGDNLLEKGTVAYFLMNQNEKPSAGLGVVAGPASPEETAGFGIEDAASLVILTLVPGGAIEGITFVLPKAKFSGGASLSLSEGEVRGGYWSIPAGETSPDRFVPFTEGTLELIEADMESGSTIAARFNGSIGVFVASVPASADFDTAADIGLVINEISAQGEPMDWFELYNASPLPLNLADFVLADDLEDASKRTPFPPDIVIQPGDHLQIYLDKDGWPGFALGRDEELGIWTTEGNLVDSVDWTEGQADEGKSLARVPDGSGDFQTVNNPSPGSPN